MKSGNPFWTGASCLLAMLLAASGGLIEFPAARAETSATTTAPTSQPAPDAVLVRIGDAGVVTQQDFEKAILQIPEKGRLAAVNQTMAELVETELFLLHLKDHPELASQEDVEAEFQRQVKAGKIDSWETKGKQLAEQGITLEEYRNAQLVTLARRKLALQGVLIATDEANLKEMWDAHTDYWDGSRVTLRHILKRVRVYFTPAEREAKRREIEKIREDLLSGKRTWDECVRESECEATRVRGGSYGLTPRYGRVIEAVIKAAWPLEVGQISDVVQSQMGYHIVEVTKRTGGYRDFDDPQTRAEMRGFLQRNLYREEFFKARAKYPVIGVRAPDLSKILPRDEGTTATQPASQPSRQRIVTSPSD